MDNAIITHKMMIYKQNTTFFRILSFFLFVMMPVPYCYYTPLLCHLHEIMPLFSIKEDEAKTRRLAAMGQEMQPPLPRK